MEKRVPQRLLYSDQYPAPSPTGGDYEGSAMDKKTMKQPQEAPAETGSSEAPQLYNPPISKFYIPDDSGSDGSDTIPTTARQEREAKKAKASEHGTEAIERGKKAVKVKKELIEEEVEQVQTSLGALVLSETERVMFPGYGLQKGDVSPKKLSFCLWKIVTRYPCRYVGKANTPRVAPFFEPEALLGRQAWDFFYVWNPPTSQREPFVLVPTDQFQRFLDGINGVLQSCLTIPHDPNGSKFRVTFGEFGTPRPRFLGRIDSGSVDEYDALMYCIPFIHAEDNLKALKPQTVLYFEEKMEEIYKGTVNRSTKKKSGKSKEQRAQVHRNWSRSAKRVQRYLGLRERASANIEANKHNSAFKTPSGGHIIGMNMPAPHNPEGTVVFVAMDIEAFEFNHHTITEVGLAKLDTRDIVGVPPGEGCENWFQLVRARHLRIKENAHAVNRVHVLGREENFDFGKSEFVDEVDVLDILSSSLETPCGTRQDGRPVVLVGHGISSDISYVKEFGYDVHANKALLEIVDTAELHQHLRRRPGAAGLETVLNDLELSHRNLHNAGNDAVYTLRAMLMLAVRAREQSLAASREGKEEKKKKMRLSHPTSRPDDDGWSTGGEMSDGGIVDYRNGEFRASGSQGGDN